MIKKNVVKYWKVWTALVVSIAILLVSFFSDTINRRITNDIEAGAKIVLAVDSTEYGEALVALWDTTYPQFRGVVDYKVVGDYLDMSVDIIYGRLDEVYEVQDQLLSFSETYTSHESNKDYYLQVDEKIVFHPVYYDGLVFVYNETMLKELGIDTLDADGDGLPETIDTFEELFLLCEAWGRSISIYHEKPLSSVFPIYFADLWSFYPFLTVGGWSLQEGENLGYDEESFLATVEFLYELGNYRWVYGEKTWNYETVIREESAPFSMVGDWMLYEVNASEIRYARFPSYQGVQLKPLVYIYGYSINGNTSYPIAAQKVIDLLGSSEGIQLAVDYGNHVAVIPKEIYSRIQIDSNNMIDWIEAYRYSQVVYKAQVLKEYYESELIELFEKVFNHTIMPTEATEQIYKEMETE